MDLKCKELTNVQQYICLSGACTEPPVRETVTQLKREQRTQRLRSVVHANSGTSFSRKKASVKQQSIPSYSVFQ